MAKTLDLTTERVESQVVNIDGNPYPLAHPDDLTVGDRLRMAKLGSVAEKLDGDNASDITEEDIDKIEQSIDDLIATALPTAEPELLARLPFDSRIAVINVFTDSLGAGGDSQANNETSSD